RGSSLIVFDGVFCSPTYKHIFKLTPGIFLRFIVGIQTQSSVSNGIIDIPRDNKVKFKFSLCDRSPALVQNILPYAVFFFVIVVPLPQCFQGLFLVKKSRIELPVESGEFLTLVVGQKSFYGYLLKCTNSDGISGGRILSINVTDYNLVLWDGDFHGRITQ